VSSSTDEREEQTIPQGSCPQGEAVNPLKAGGALSSSAVRDTERPDGRRYELLGNALEAKNMYEALRRVEGNKGAAGIDGMEVKDLRPYLKAHWQEIKGQLLEGTYKPKPVRRAEIPKPDGGVRFLGIPCVIDRLIQQSLLQVLTPIFDPGFSEHSYGFRPGRGAHQAVQKAKEYVGEGYTYVVDIDLEKFFDRVNHDALMARVARKVEDKRVLKLIRAYLNSGIMVDGVCIRTEEGTPQGGPLSPLLSNVMLDDLDKELEKRGHRFVRYADDCNIYVKSQRAGERVMGNVKRFLGERLKLKVNEAKSAVGKVNARKFLGFTLSSGKRSRIRIASKALERLKDRIRELTRRSWGIRMGERIRRLNVYLRGWIGYYRLAESLSVLNQLDGWIRRRLRVCLLKQWRKPKARWRNLVKLGVSEEWAYMISGSRKGCYRLSLTHQLNKALGLEYWKKQGLLSLAETYLNIRIAL
jgi:group II intron reverse transcriptase/maturase